MEMSVSKPYRFIILSEDIEEVKKMREYNNQVIPDKSTAIAVDTNEQFIFQDGKWRKMTIKMTIDKTISELEILKKNTFSYMTANQAFTTAIETMKKYQKIQEIVKFGNANELGFEYVGEKITEVLEDGNIN